MSRCCELTGTGPLTGNTVSHSNRRVKRRFLPNLIRTRLRSECLRQDCRLRITAKALRHVDKAGGLDGFLLQADERALSGHARVLKRQIAKKLAAAALDTAQSDTPES